MKTVQEHAPETRENDKNVLVNRLERTQNDLVQLRSQLDSYRCEPRTYRLFEYFENLKNRMDTLSATNSEILAKLKQQCKTTSDPTEKAKQQFSKFDQLKIRIADYRKKCINR